MEDDQWKKIEADRKERAERRKDWWKRIEPGTFVRVVFPLAPLEKTKLLNVFKFLGYSIPHGYARCEDANGGVVLIHPEALEKVRGCVKKYGTGNEIQYLEE